MDEDDDDLDYLDYGNGQEENEELESDHDGDEQSDDDADDLATVPQADVGGLTDALPAEFVDSIREHQRTVTMYEVAALLASRVDELEAGFPALIPKPTEQMEESERMELKYRFPDIASDAFSRVPAHYIHHRIAIREYMAGLLTLKIRRYYRIGGIVYHHDFSASELKLLQDDVERVMVADIPKDYIAYGTNDVISSVTYLNKAQIDYILHLLFSPEANMPYSLQMRYLGGLTEEVQVTAREAMKASAEDQLRLVKAANDERSLRKLAFAMAIAFHNARILPGTAVGGQQAASNVIDTQGIISSKHAAGQRETAFSAFNIVKAMLTAVSLAPYSYFTQMYNPSLQAEQKQIDTLTIRHLDRKSQVLFGTILDAPNISNKTNLDSDVAVYRLAIDGLELETRLKVLELQFNATKLMYYGVELFYITQRLKNWLAGTNDQQLKEVSVFDWPPHMARIDLIVKGTAEQAESIIMKLGYKIQTWRTQQVKTTDTTQDVFAYLSSSLHHRSLVLKEVIVTPYTNTEFKDLLGPNYTEEEASDVSHTFTTAEWQEMKVGLLEEKRDSAPPYTWPREGKFITQPPDNVIEGIWEFDRATFDMHFQPDDTPLQDMLRLIDPKAEIQYEDSNRFEDIIAQLNVNRLPGMPEVKSTQFATQMRFKLKFNALMDSVRRHQNFRRQVGYTIIKHHFDYWLAEHPPLPDQTPAQTAEYQKEKESYLERIHLWLDNFFPPLIRTPLKLCQAFARTSTIYREISYKMFFKDDELKRKRLPEEQLAADTVKRYRQLDVLYVEKELEQKPENNFKANQDIYRKLHSCDVVAKGDNYQENLYFLERYIAVDATRSIPQNPHAIQAMLGIEAVQHHMMSVFVQKFVREGHKAASAHVALTVAAMSQDGSFRSLTDPNLGGTPHSGVLRRVAKGSALSRFTEGAMYDQTDTVSDKLVATSLGEQSRLGTGFSDFVASDIYLHQNKKIEIYSKGDENISYYLNHDLTIIPLDDMIHARDVWNINITGDHHIISTPPPVLYLGHNEKGQLERSKYPRGVWLLRDATGVLRVLLDNPEFEVVYELRFNTELLQVVLVQYKPTEPKYAPVYFKNVFP